jgi:hypothetical protein
MDAERYDVWYDANEVDENNHVQVLRSWARPDLDVTYGKIVRLGDDEQEPVSARIVSFDESTDIITLEVLFDQAHIAVA